MAAVFSYIRGIWCFSSFDLRNSARSFLLISLTVGGNLIALTANFKTLVFGKIYNVTHVRTSLMPRDNPLAS